MNVPTQFNVGEFEEKQKAKVFEKMSKKELRQYQKKHPCPLVVDDKGDLRITDEQHRANAFTLAEHHSILRALRSHGQATMYGYIKNSYPAYSEGEKKAGKKPLSIKEWMIKNNYVFLEDRGKPRPYDQLPTEVTEMGNDAYRSLAGLLENKAYVLKPGVYFAQFKVADWLREQLGLSDKEIDSLLEDKKTRKKLLSQASHLLRSPLAAKEPWAFDDDYYTKKLPACVIGKIVNWRIRRPDFPRVSLFASRLRDSDREAWRVDPGDEPGTGPRNNPEKRKAREAQIATPIVVSARSFSFVLQSSSFNPKCKAKRMGAWTR